MTLENLSSIGKLKPHKAERVEIQRLFAAADRSLSDARNKSINPDTRLDVAYKVITQSALVAMLGNGFRPSTSEPGHHQVLIQALPKTIGLSAERMRALESYRSTRNLSDYKGVPVQQSVANDCVEDAARLLADVRAWIKKNRSDLV